MWILIIYILIVVVGEVHRGRDRSGLGSTFPLASLPVSLTLFFAVLAFGWPLAVRWTEPKHAKRAKLQPEFAGHTRRVPTGNRGTAHFVQPSCRAIRRPKLPLSA